MARVLTANPIYLPDAYYMFAMRYVDSSVIGLGCVETMLNTIRILRDHIRIKNSAH